MHCQRFRAAGVDGGGTGGIFIFPAVPGSFDALGTPSPLHSTPDSLSSSMSRPQDHENLRPCSPLKGFCDINVEDMSWCQGVKCFIILQTSAMAIAIKQITKEMNKPPMPPKMALCSTPISSLYLSPPIQAEHNHRIQPSSCVIKTTNIGQTWS
jgi:hypothetical protein